jgi:outer membrane protein OmpA-like peptidoglycan-associated protein
MKLMIRKCATTVRTLCCGLLVSAVLTAPAAAQDTETRPALPTVHGDTGIWFLPTAEVLPKGKISGSLFLENEHRPQGITRWVQFGPTVGVGVTDRLELFASYRGAGVERDHRPIFAPGAVYGGIAQDVPYANAGWTGLKGGPTFLGAKVNFLSQSRQQPIALALRGIVKIPTGSNLVHDGELNGIFDLIASGEIAEKVELTATGGFLWRRQPAAFQTQNSTTIGVGAAFPSRSRLRALVEASGELVNNGEMRRLGAATLPIGQDGSLPPLVSTTDDIGHIRAGLVWQGRSGWFVHYGLSYALSYASDDITTRDEPGSPWGYDVRIGFHPGTKKFVAPPPPPPPVAAAEPPPAAPVAAPPTPPANRNPSVTIVCNPCTVEVGKTLQVTANGTDPDNDPLTYRWTAPTGAFSAPAASSTMWTAPMQVGNVPLTVTVSDSRGGTANATVTATVTRPPQKTFTFDDVHFDFDKYNLKPEALKVLDDAVATLRENPELRLTIEGHCDSIGTVEYNLALGERRARTARDYLVSRGVAGSRFDTVSFGEESPKATNETAEGRAMNRRAALVVKIQ